MAILVIITLSGEQKRDNKMGVGGKKRDYLGFKVILQDWEHEIDEFHTLVIIENSTQTKYIFQYKHCIEQEPVGKRVIQ